MATQTTSDSSATEALLRLRFDAYELDEADARLTRDGRPIAIAPRPFAVLCALARSPRTLVTKNALLDSVWGHRFVSDSVLKTTVSALRAALDDDAKQPRYIETVSRRGYRFIAVTSVPAAPAASTDLTTITQSLIQSPVAAAPITGRSDALERLRSAWALACTGKHRLVWVAGEPGVGKTTLIDCFAAEVGHVRCAHGQCVDQGGTGEPCLPVLNALSELCRRDVSFGALMRTVAPMWLLQLPWLTSPEERELLRRDLSGSGQARMLREFGELLDRYTAEKPLLLVTEDLHWSDQATLQLMDHIARRRGAMRLLWVATYRLTEVIAADHPLKSLRRELKLHGLADEIVLDAFSEAEVADYLAKRLPALGAEEDVVRALHVRTEGLPLFVADVVNDLLRHADATQPAESAARSRLESMAIPENLAGIIEQYVERLTAEERAVLETASACGVEFRLNTVAEVLEREIATVARSCAELAREQRWLIHVPAQVAGSASDTRYAFRHALYREVLHNRTGPVARAELHRKIAVALEREQAEGADVSSAELASHFELGHELMRALRYYAEAAESALLHFSPDQTMSITEHALTLLPMVERSEARTSVEMTLATLQGTAAIQALGSGSIEVKRAFGRVLPLLDEVPQHPLRGLALSGLGFQLYMRGEPDEAFALAERCERLSAATDDRTALLCASLVHALVHHLRGRPRSAREWLEKGLSAREGGDETTRAVFAADPDVIILGYLALALLHVGLVDQGRARIRDAYARARLLGEPAPRMAALWFDALFGLRLGNAEHVAQVADELRTLSEEYALAQGRAAHLWFSGWAEARLGDAKEGHSLIRKGYDEGLRLGIRACGSETLGYAVEALARTGAWTAARHELKQAMQCAESIGERHFLPQLLLLDARIADALGEPKRARDALRQAIAEAGAQEAPWLQMLALSALCEREEAAREDFDALRLVIDGLKEGGDTLPVAHARALVGKSN